jgi:thioredoxin reductase (NADPH)
MAASSTTSALDASTQTFPILSSEQIDRLRPLGRVRHVKQNEVLFQPSDVNVPFFVILSGRMEIVEPCFDGECAIAVHDRAGEFTGEISMISGQRCLVLGRMTEEGDLLEIASGALQSIVAKDAELGEIFLRAFILRRIALVQKGLGNVVVLGSRHSARTLEIREFLTRNFHPHYYLDLDTDRESQELLDRFHVDVSEIPVVICNGVHVMRNPSVHDLAACLGFTTGVDMRQLRDLIIVGGGPAGLAGAVYAASEGLDVVVTETHAPGGQAGCSSRIENYLGFPTGVSGQELAGRATTQAQKFGAKFLIARSVESLNCERHPYELRLDGRESMYARSIMIATGARYNRLRLHNAEQFEGSGIYYGATYVESQSCGGEEVAVVGGGNSAGQAAVFLSETAPLGHMLVRSGELRSTMSRYLIQRLVENPRIKLYFNTEITAVEGDETGLQRVTWKDKSTGEVSSHELRHVFVMTGASPCTEWLRDTLALDEKGFILTGRDLDAVSNGGPRWPLQRAPLMLETSLPGVFAVGDVRSGNVKRVASAVGEGAIAVHMVHRVLAEL